MLVRVYERYTSRVDWLHGFYAFSSYSQIDLTASMDAVSVGWARMELDPASGPWLNSTSSNNNDWVMPADPTPAASYWEGRSILYNLNVYASDGDSITLSDGSTVSTVDGVVGDPARRAQAVSALAQEDGLHLVARISCFRDQALAGAGVGGPLMTQGGNVWYDASGYRWVSPVSQQVRDYLVQLCVELAQMGFDEILLESAGFPDLGETHVLATSENRPEDLTGPVAQFLEELSGALADTDAALSVLASQETALGTDELTGITPELLAEYAHRVWTGLPEEGVSVLVAPLERAGMDQAEQRIVSLGGPREEGSWTTLTAG